MTRLIRKYKVISREQEGNSDWTPPGLDIGDGKEEKADWLIDTWWDAVGNPDEIRIKRKRAAWQIV